MCEPNLLRKPRTDKFNELRKLPRLFVKCRLRHIKGDKFMIRLDHFVINIDNDMKRLKELKRHIEPLGFPFEPTWGKGTKGFQVANVWIGLQYLEMVWLKKKDGGGWKADWVEKYNNGHRGIIAIYLMTDRLDEIREELRSRGINVSEPERISFRWFFGLLKKTMPWRSMYTDLSLEPIYKSVLVN